MSTALNNTNELIKSQKIKDPISALTHFIGFVLSIPISCVLIVLAVNHGTVYHIVSYSVFGLSLLLLYGASTIYHSLSLPEAKSNVLRRIDHMMIFVLIAGTYSPICLIPLRGVWGYSMLIVIWTMAIAGILLKTFWLSAPRALSTVIYVVMGWTAVFAFYPLSNSISLVSMILLFSGGIMYTVGALIYALKRPKLNLKYFGFHEIFHIFVLLGSAFHIILMFFIF